MSWHHWGALTGLFEPLDRQLVAVVAEVSGERSLELALAVALASRATRHGHVCWELADCAGRRLLDTELGAELEELELGQTDARAELRFPELEAWLSALRASTGVRTLGEPDGKRAPLVLAGSRIYLERYREQEEELAQLLVERATPLGLVGDPEQLRQELERHYELGDALTHPQRLATALAWLSPLTVIVGGPGTGKTTAVARLLALAANMTLQTCGKLPRVLLLAPTGKAATRLAESIRHQLGNVDCPTAVRETLATEASTIHRALGRGAWAGTPEPLAADLVVVDEASMVDLGVMRRLLLACRKVERLVLLGDPGQLASVDAGAVLSDLTHGRSLGYSPALARVLSQVTGLAVPETTGPPVGLSDAIVELTHSRRFSESSALGQLAAAVRGGDLARALELLEGNETEVRFLELPSGARESELLEAEVCRGYAPLWRTRSAESALEALWQYRVFAGPRRGPFGVLALNERLARLAAGARAQYEPWLLTENASSLSLYNGDLGVARRRARDAGREVAFAGLPEVRRLAMARLPACELAYAMTVHKGQGSEVDEVLFVLPEPGSPLLSRELLYTGLTRARRRCTLIGQKAAIGEALARRVSRQTGLAEALRCASLERA